MNHSQSNSLVTAKTKIRLKCMRIDSIEVRFINYVNNERKTKTRCGGVEQDEFNFRGIKHFI